MRTSSARLFLATCLLLSLTALLHAQTTTGTIEGTTRDTTGAILPKTNVTAVNDATGFTRSTVSGDSGNYQIPALPVGDYTVTAEQKGFQKQARKIHIDLGASGIVDFSLAVGQVSQEVEVKAEAEAVEPTRSMVSSVIAEREIQTLPVNGRQFIDFALLAPGVTIGDTTSGSTDVIIEPVTKLSFAGQNIHYNFVAIDGGDNISTASGIQKTTPSQEAVQEFRVINSSYSTEFGRAVGGIVNVITKSGTNSFHGSVYEYFRNDKLDAKNPLVSPNLATCNTPGDPFSGGCTPLDKLRQNQYGVTMGGPIKKDRTFFFANYEAQRHREAPFYNSVILQHLECDFTIDPRCGTPNETRSINDVKTQIFGLPAENLNVTRDIDYDNGIIKIDHSINQKNSLSARYFVNDQRATNLSPLNDGFDLPSGFKNNQFRDQSVLGSLTSTLSNSLVNDLRFQYAHRFFNFPAVSTQPHLEVTNTFTVGVNRGNPDFYEEGRVEIVDDVTKIVGRHNISFGGDYNHVNTKESFPLFYPFEADFGNLDAFLGTDFVGAPDPFVIFFERFPSQPGGVTATSLDTSVYQGTAISQSVRNEAKGEIGHVYSGLYIQDKWRATDKLTINYGLRWEFERWPAAAINSPMKNFDPRAGLAYALGGKHNFVIRAGAGLFHGIIPSPLLMCQIPSCGGVFGPLPGRESIQDSLNSVTRLSAAGADPFTNAANLAGLLGPGTYPAGSLDATIVRFAQNHKPPYGAQMSLGLEFQPTATSVLDITYLHVRGIHLGSFYNVTQPDPTGTETMHDSRGNVGQKTLYCSNFPCAPPLIFPSVKCLIFTGCLPPNAPSDFIGVAVDFEADSRWDSQYDGLLVNFNKRLSNHFAMGVSYTFAKGIDDGPNPSFVLIPQDSNNFAAERAISSDDVKHRFVGNATFTAPENVNRIVNGWSLSTIITLESPHYFTKFAGFDANGDIFGNNDRVGIEGRNTFRGDSYQTVDMRLSRTFGLTEKFHLQALAEAFNLMNTRNIRFYNTAYGAADFCPVGGAQGGCPAGGPLFFEGSPNPNYGTPRAVFNPRQVQLALRVTW